MELNKDAQIITNLKKLYESFGFNLYKMRKFEEYSLYLENKNFLSDSPVITFTDVNGKLLALKPDVTLSIIKNIATKLEGNARLYYDENVYRFDKKSNEYKEINQLGLELLGEIDNVLSMEIIFLAIKSMEQIEKNFVLEVANANILTGLFDKYNIESYSLRKKIIAFLDKRNYHDLESLCIDKNISNEFISLMKEVILTNNDSKEILKTLLKVSTTKELAEGVNELKAVIDALPQKYQEKVVIDLSLTADTDYYSGIIFKGYIESVPRAILSGGRYDKLVKKVNNVKNISAMGFALNVSELAVLNKSDEYDADVLLVYGNNDPETVISMVNSLIEEGKKVIVQKEEVKNIKVRKILTI